VLSLHVKHLVVYYDYNFYARLNMVAITAVVIQLPAVVLNVCYCNIRLEIVGGKQVRFLAAAFQSWFVIVVFVDC